MKRRIHMVFIGLLCLAFHSLLFSQNPPAHSFFVIHCDPDYATNLHFNRLRQMVDTATAHHVPLTFEFSPQWVDMILNDPDKLNTVRAWQSMGHEVGGHHHGIYHCFWDGYTNYPPDSIAANQPVSPNCPTKTFLGTMPPVWDKMDELAGDSLLLTWGASDLHPAVDLYPDLPFRTDGGRDYPEQGFSNPYRVTHGPTTVGGNTYGPYTTCSVNYYFIDDAQKVDDLIVLYNDSLGFSGQYEVVGVVTHVFDFQQALTQPPPNYFYKWIKFIEGKGCQTVRQILRNHPVCDQPVATYEAPISRSPVSLKLFPNPASETVHLQLPDAWQKHAFQTQLFDYTGRLVKIFKNQTKLTINDLPAGIYFIQILSPTGNLGAKLIRIPSL